MEDWSNHTLNHYKVEFHIMKEFTPELADTTSDLYYLHNVTVGALVSRSLRVELGFGMGNDSGVA